MQELEFFFSALFTNNNYYTKVHYKEKNIGKINYTNSRGKENVRSDQSSLSFQVAHCHRQLINLNMYIINIYMNRVYQVKYR